MRKFFYGISLLLCLALLMTGCQLALPAGGADMAPAVGIWLEAREEAPAADYLPQVDFQANGALGLVMLTQDVDEEGHATAVYGRTLTPQFQEVGFTSRTNLVNGTVQEDSSSFQGTLYLDDGGQAPEDFWLWRVYEDGTGGYYAKGSPEHISISHAQLEALAGGSYSQSFSYKTTQTDSDGRQQATEYSYTIAFKAIGRLEQVEIIELDGDFQKLSQVSLDIQDGDEYTLQPGAAYAAILETYQGAGGRERVCTLYSVDDALDYEGEQALFHSLKYMGDGGMVLPRSLEIIWP